MKKQQKNNRNTYLLFLLLGSLNLINCINYSQEPTNTTRKVTYDTITPKKISNSKLQQEKDDGEPSLTQILDDLRESYKDTTKIDTTFLLNGIDTVTVELRHYCTYDYKINLPVRYRRMYKLSSFQTHDFISTLEFRLNSKVIFKGFIEKEDFRNLLDDELKKYGVLLYPNLEVEDNGIAIQYSISVPLSDVGRGFIVEIDTLGKKHITED